MELSGEIQDCVEDCGGSEPCIFRMVPICQRELFSPVGPSRPADGEDLLVLYTNSKSS